MPVNFCLPKDRVDSFVNGLKSGEISPEKLVSMTSKERHDFISKYVGEDAAQKVNAEFETKLLLKNQQLGMISWAKNVSGIKPSVRQDLIQRIKNIEKVLDPEDEKAFLHDLAATRLGADVTTQEAKTIAEMSRGLSEAKSKMDPNTYTFPNVEDRMDYGRKLVQMEDYVSDLKNNTKKMRFSDLKRNPFGTVKKATVESMGLMKSVTASLDNSVIGRQGLKIALTHPTIWAKNSLKSFNDMVRTWGGKKVIEEVRAEIASRPNALNGTYRREGLALGNHEEAFPTSLPEKIPIAGRLFKGSETSFTAFQYRSRADLMDMYVNLAEKTGGDIKGMGLLANSLTGRGRLGKFEPIADTMNKVFFAPRFVKSNIDALTGHLADYGKMGSLAKREAAINTLKIVAGIATILGTAKSFAPDGVSVDLDPRSTDFGKIKVGSTRFDVSGGMSGLVTLASRLAPTLHNGQWGQYTKSGSGNITKLNSSDFGARTTTDVLVDFVSGKLSPAAGIVKDVSTGKDFQGNDITFWGEVSKVLLPIGVSTFNEAQNDPNSANSIAVMILDGLGIGANTYGTQKTDSWKNTTSKELLKFKDNVGEDAFKMANKDYETEYSDFLIKLGSNEKYQKLSDDEKLSVQAQAKTTIRSKILKRYGFVYKADKKDNSGAKDVLKEYFQK